MKLDGNAVKDNKLESTSYMQLISVVLKVSLQDKVVFYLNRLRDFPDLCSGQRKALEQSDGVT